MNRDIRYSPALDKFVYTDDGKIVPNPKELSEKELRTILSKLTSSNDSRTLACTLLVVLERITKLESHGLNQDRSSN